MTDKEAIRKLEYLKKAYQMLIDEKVDNGKLVGDGVRGERKAETPLDEAYKDMIEALDFAIKTLEQQSSEDCISRAEALRHRHLIHDDDGIGYSVVRVDEIIDLPSVIPQPKIGQWRHYEGMLMCSECGAEFYDDIMEYCGDDVPKCCPDCGAKMQEEEK